MPTLPRPMMIFTDKLRISTPGRGTIDITGQVQNIVEASRLVEGLCNVFIHHTSASLILCENADPTVRTDLERFAAALAPDGDPSYEHIDEGPDDMSAHIRSILTQSSIDLPFAKGRLAVGTWQGLYLWEHRTSAHSRQLTVTVRGA